MPPRISSHSLPACSVEISSLGSCGSPAAASTFVSRRPCASPLRPSITSSSPSAAASSSSPSSSSSFSRCFSTTPSRLQNVPLNKQAYLKWMKKAGFRFERHKPGRTNYIQPSPFQLVGDQKADPRQPFPNNPFFKAPLVLDEAAREMIWKRVFMDEEPIKVVSAELGIDIRRVAAVVRMKTVEKEWVNEGKKLATPYRKAIMSMLFLHKYRKGQPPQPLEPHNEIHVHSYTMQQLFVPTSESRQFTREDAAEAFHHTMLSADERIPHKEYVEYIKRIDKGMSGEKSKKLFVEESKASQAADEARDRQVGENANKLTTAVPTPRFEFRFKKMRADDVGKDGRSRKGVGWRYGAPYEDRKKDQIKIPTQIV